MLPDRNGFMEWVHYTERRWWTWKSRGSPDAGDGGRWEASPRGTPFDELGLTEKESVRAQLNALIR